MPLPALGETVMGVLCYFVQVEVFSLNSPPPQIPGIAIRLN